MWFILLFLIPTTTAFPITTFPSTTTTPLMIYDSVLGYPCHSDINCGGLVANSRCLQSKCACQPGYIPDGIMHCLGYSSMTNTFASID